MYVVSFKVETSNESIIKIRPTEEHVIQGGALPLCAGIKNNLYFMFSVGGIPQTFVSTTTLPLVEALELLCLVVVNGLLHEAEKVLPNVLSLLKGMLKREESLKSLLQVVREGFARGVKSRWCHRVILFIHVHFFFLNI